VIHHISNRFSLRGVYRATHSQIISPRPIKAENRSTYSDNLNFCLCTSKRVYILKPTRTNAASSKIHSEIWFESKISKCSDNQASDWQGCKEETDHAIFSSNRVRHLRRFSKQTNSDVFVNTRKAEKESKQQARGGEPLLHKWFAKPFIGTACTACQFLVHLPVSHCKHVLSDRT
jgi:hypothetical protein